MTFYPAKNVFVLVSLFFVCAMCPGCRARAYNDQNRSPSLSPGGNDNPMHGPSIDYQDLPRDLRQPYPGKSFGPMGPIGRQFPEEVALRNLANGNTEEHGINDPHAPTKPLREYQVFHVEFHRVETPFVIGIWIFFASIAKIGFHMAPRLSKMFPESCLLIVVGVVIGVLLFQASEVHVSPLTPDTFFLYMLPPIILDAGYFMPNRLFFDHLGTILLFAVVGTIFNTLSIGASLWLLAKSGLFGFTEDTASPLLDMFLFSALISAVDPVAVLAVFEEIHVNEILYIVVFGESLLNDAVTVVLYHMFETYSEMGPLRITYTEILSGLASFLVVAIGGTIIGVFWGFATGFVTRFTNEVRVIEPIFIFVMAYLAYLNAEIFHMSGILAITFCGITMKNYVEANISHKSHTTVKYTMKMLSSSSETIIFMFLGVATVNNHHVWNTWFVVMTIVCCSVYRIVGVMVLTAIANRFRLHKLDKVEKFVMSYGGLRGAVAFALVLLIDPKHVPLQPMFVTTTIAVIYFTVFIQGITIKPLVKILNVKRAEKRKPTMNERIHERIMDHIMSGIEDILGKHGNYHVRDKFKRFDNKFIRPYLVRNHCGAEPKILETYSKLAMKDALDYIRRNASTIGNISGTESMSAIFRNYSNTGQFNSRLIEKNYVSNMAEVNSTPKANIRFTAKIYERRIEDVLEIFIAYYVFRDYMRLCLQCILDRRSNRVNALAMIRWKIYPRMKKISSPSCSQLEPGWNIDLQELEYYPSRKDLTDAKIHHLLAEELCKPYKRHRRLSYSRHAVNDRDLSTQVNYKMHMNIRRMMGEHKHRHKRSKKLLKDGSKQNHVSFPELQQQNGSTKLFSQDYMNGVLYETEGDDDNSKPSSKEDWDSAITFTARTSESNPCGEGSHTDNGNDGDDYDDDDESDGDGTRRHHGEEGDGFRVTTPTATESVLPWKREDDYDTARPVKQNEFPAWCSNKEYLAYSSPSATFLGGIEQPKFQSVIGLFRRDSIATPEIPQTLEDPDESDEYTAMRPDSMVSPARKLESPTRSKRRGSMMELGSITIHSAPKEQTNKNGSHSLPECWNSQRLRLQTNMSGGGKVASLSTALITSSSESSEDYEED